MPPVVLEGDPWWQGRCRRSGKPDETEIRTSQGLETISHAQHQEPKARRLDECGPDELLDDWMVSAPAADPSSD
jgi:hypothetical protein